MRLAYFQANLIFLELIITKSFALTNFKCGWQTH